LLLDLAEPRTRSYYLRVDASERYEIILDISTKEKIYISNRCGHLIDLYFMNQCRSERHWNLSLCLKISYFTFLKKTDRQSRNRKKDNLDFYFKARDNLLDLRTYSLTNTFFQSFPLLSKNSFFFVKRSLKCSWFDNLYSDFNRFIIRTWDLISLKNDLLTFQQI